MRKTWLVTATLLLILAAFSYGLYAYIRPPQLAAQLLYGNGHIEGHEIRVAPEVSGQVVASHLVEGRRVAMGDILIEIDDTRLLIEKEGAAAEIEALVQQRERVRRQLETALHHLGTAQENLERHRTLREGGSISAQQLEQSEDAVAEASGQADALRAEGAATEAKIEAARRQLEAIEYKIGKTRVAAPISATVLAKTVEPGEQAQPGRPVAVLVDLDEIELRVFVPEAELAKIKLGSPARIKVDAFPDRLFEGRVARIDQRAQFTPRDIHMPNERVRMVFGVYLSIDNPEGRLRPGMPADAWILWREESGWPDRLFVPG